MSLSLQLGLGLGTRLVRGGFSPTALFAAGEQGAWYDPSDLTTLFQGTATSGTGLTPVTAAGQSVGFIGDKSQGFARTDVAPNILSSTTGWTRGSNSVDGVFTVSGGVATYTLGAGDSGAARMVYAISGLVVGRSYEILVSPNTSSGAGDRVVVWTSNSAGTGGSSLLQLTATSWNTFVGTTYRYIAPATATTMYFAISTVGAVAGDTVSADSIVINALPGNHATQATAAQRPTYGVVPATGRRNLLTFTEQFDNAAWGKTNLTVAANVSTAPDGATTADKIVETAVSGVHNIVQFSDVVLGQQYVWSVFVKPAERNIVFVQHEAAGTGFGGAFVSLSGAGTVSNYFNGLASGVSVAAVADGWYRVQLTFTANATGSRRSSVATSPAVGTQSYLGDGTSGVLVWGGQLEVGSTATAYQRVGTAFDVTEAGVTSCSYLSFDGTDDGMLTGNIVPGADKAQVFAGVRLVSAAGSGVLAEMSTNSDSTNGTLSVWRPSSGGGSQWYMQSRGTGGVSVSASGYPAPSTNVFAGTSDIAGDSLITRVDGTQVGSSTADQGTGSFTTQPLYIGRRGGTTQPFNGQIFGLILRFGTNLSAATVTQTETWLANRVAPTVVIP